MKSLSGAILILAAACTAIFLWMHGADAAEMRPCSAIVVESGDTLWSIAVKRSPRQDPRRTIERIIALNDLDDVRIVPGQRLLIPSNGQE